MLHLKEYHECGLTFEAAAGSGVERVQGFYNERMRIGRDLGVCAAVTHWQAARRDNMLFIDAFSCPVCHLCALHTTRLPMPRKRLTRRCCQHHTAMWRNELQASSHE